jgi:hypothetical protein
MVERDGLKGDHGAGSGLDILRTPHHTQAPSWARIEPASAAPSVRATYGMAVITANGHGGTNEAFVVRSDFSLG